MKMRSNAPVVVLLALLSLVGATGAGVTSTASATGGEAGTERRLSRPNVVLITVDDMRADDLAHMPRTRRLLRQFELTDFISNHPACCPARAQLLTGQFGQRNGVFDNGGGPWGGYDRLRGKNNTMARWFQRAGYQTSLVGKFMNGWRPRADARPAGWTSWQPLTGSVYSAYGYAYVDNGPVRPAPAGLHTNDFVTRETARRISGFSRARSAPFLIWASYVAPHGMTSSAGVSGPPLPAARHVADKVGAVPVSESSPAYQDPTDRQLARGLYEDSPTAPNARQTERAAETSVRELNQARLESLLSVDEGVARILDKLAATRELADTIVVFTSDNGFLMGEHGLMGKSSYYEESLRIPLLARGPGLPQGRFDKASMVVDIPGSLAAEAGVPVKRSLDGRTDLFDATAGWAGPAGTLIQSGADDRPWLWRGLRNERYTLVHAATPDGSERSLFDRETDPFQLNDLIGTEEGAVVEAELEGYLRSLEEGR